jgi:HEAT repeat protein
MAHMRPRYADLLKALKDPDPVRSDKAYDAILFDRGEALPDLIEAYAVFPKDPTVRYYIVQLMGFSEDRRATETVIGALSDPDCIVRAEACRALEDLRARDALPDLHARMEDMDAKVRTAAEETIRALGGWRS